MSVSALSVAQAFLDLAKAENIRLDNMKLQKLVFFAHGVALAGLGCRLIEEDIKAWQFGPVIPRLYNRLKNFGADEVTEIVPKEGDRIDPIEGEMMRPIQAVWNVYKNRTGAQLSALSHIAGSPWDIVWNQQQRQFEEIPDAVIADYYRKVVKRKAY